MRYGWGEHMSAVEEMINERLKNDIDPREFDAPGFQKDPFPLYKRLRDHHPIYHDRFHNRWVITRYWDVDAVFQNSEAYTRGIYDEDGPYKFGSRHVFGPNILEYGRGDRGVEVDGAAGVVGQRPQTAPGRDVQAVQRSAVRGEAGRCRRALSESAGEGDCVVRR